MIIDVLAYLACAVAVLAAGSRVWVTRGFARRSEIWTLCFGGALIALAALLLAPSTSSLLARLEAPTGVDVLKLLGDAVRMAGAGVAGLLATQIRDERAPSSRTWLRALLAVEVVLVVCFVSAGFHTGLDGAYVQASRGFGTAYDLIRLIYPIVSLGLFLVAIMPFAHGLPRGPARVGSQILAVAAVVGIAWTCWTVDDIRQMATLGRQDTADDVPSVVLEIAFVVAAGSGMTVTVWDRLAHGATAWLRAVRSYRAMGPLWHALCGPGDAMTGVVRPRVAAGAPVGLAERLAVQPWRASIARYRRVIEIRDAQLSLLPYRPVTAAGQDWTPADEAAAIVAGLQAFAAVDRRAGTGADEPAKAVDATAAIDGGPSWPVSTLAVSIEAEADRLVEVTRAFVAARRHAPAVV